MLGVRKERKGGNSAKSPAIAKSTKKEREMNNRREYGEEQDEWSER